MLIKCAAYLCPKTATKGSDFCLSHALEIDGGRLLDLVLRTGCDHVYEPAPVLPRSKVFDGITIAIRQETES
jgi:hypothetical protein